MQITFDRGTPTHFSTTYARVTALGLAVLECTLSTIFGFHAFRRFCALWATCSLTSYIPERPKRSRSATMTHLRATPMRHGPWSMVQGA